MSIMTGPHMSLSSHTLTGPQNAPSGVIQSPEGTTGPTVTSASILEEIESYEGRMLPIIQTLLDLGDDIGAIGLGLEYIQWYATPGPCRKGTTKYMAGDDLWRRVEELTNELTQTPEATKEAGVIPPSAEAQTRRTEIRGIIDSMDIQSIYKDIRAMRPWKGRDLLLPMMDYPEDPEVEEICRGFITLTAFQSEGICSSRKWAYYYSRVEGWKAPPPPVPLEEKVWTFGRSLRTRVLGALDSLSDTGVMLAEQAGKDAGKYTSVAIHTSTTILRTCRKEWDRTHGPSDIKAARKHMTRKSEWKSAISLQRLQNKANREMRNREAMAAMALDTGAQPPMATDGTEAKLWYLP